jgi:hypothetical protein
LQALAPLPRVNALPWGFAPRDPTGPEYRPRERLFLLNCRRFPGVDAHLVHASPATLCHREGDKQSPIRTATMSGLFSSLRTPQPEIGNQGTDGRNDRMRLDNVSASPISGSWMTARYAGAV